MNQKSIYIVPSLLTSVLLSCSNFNETHSTVSESADKNGTTIFFEQDIAEVNPVSLKMENLKQALGVSSLQEVIQSSQKVHSKGARARGPGSLFVKFKNLTKKFSIILSI